MKTLTKHYKGICSLTQKLVFIFSFFPIPDSFIGKLVNIYKLVFFGKKI